MRHYVLLSLLIFLTLRLTAQSDDSTRFVKVQAWVVNRMITEVQLGRTCDTLRQQQDKTLQAAMTTILKADTVIKIHQEQIKQRDELIKIQTDRILNAQSEKQELRKEVRQQKALTVAVGVISVIALIIFL